MTGGDGTTDAEQRVPQAPRDRERTAGDRESAPSASPPPISDDVPVSDDVPIEFPEREPAELDDTTELHLMERHADDDGTVTVQILGWERENRDATDGSVEPGAGDVVRVEYALPTGERETDRYRWPTAGRYAESDFVGLVRRLGYAPSAADHVVGEFARARNENGRWRIVTGRGPRGVTDGTRHERPTNGTSSRPDAGTDGDSAATDRPDSRISKVTRRCLAGIDPMDIGMLSVLLVFLSVLAPATAAIYVGGLTAPIAALGAVLFGGAVAALWLSIVVTGDP